MNGIVEKQIIGGIETNLGLAGVGIAIPINKHSEHGVFYLNGTQIAIDDTQPYNFYVRYLETVISHKIDPKSTCNVSIAEAKLRLVAWKSCALNLHEAALSAVRNIEIDGALRNVTINKSTGDYYTVQTAEKTNFSTELSLCYIDFTIQYTENCQIIKLKCDE